MHRIVRALCELLKEYEKARPDHGFTLLMSEADIEESVITSLFVNNLDNLELEDFEKLLRHFGLESAFTNAVTPQDLLLEHNLEEFSEAWERKNQLKP